MPTQAFTENLQWTRCNKWNTDALDDLSPSHPNAPHMHPVTPETEKGAASVG